MIDLSDPYKVLINLALGEPDGKPKVNKILMSSDYYNQCVRYTKRFVDPDPKLPIKELWGIEVEETSILPDNVYFAMLDIEGSVIHQGIKDD